MRQLVRWVARCLATACLLASATAIAKAEIPYFELKQAAARAIHDKRWDEALSNIKKLTEQRSDDAKAFKDLGFVLEKLERHDEAIEALKQATAMAPGYSEAWNSLCWYQILAQDLNSARVACEGATHTDPSRRSAYINLGHTYLLAGDTEAAYRWYTESLSRTPDEKALRSGPLPDFDVFIARSWKPAESAAAAQWMQTRFQQEDMQQLRQATQFEKDCRTAIEREKYDAASGLCKRLIEIRERILGTEHTELIRALELQAWIEAKQKNLDAATTSLQRASTIEQARLEADHLSVADTLTAIAAVKNLRGDRAAVLVDLQRTLEIRRKLLGQQNMLVAQSLNNIAVTLEAMGRVAEAIPYVREAEAISELLEGPQSISTKAVLDNLARMLAANGQVDEWLVIDRRIKKTAIAK